MQRVDTLHLNADESREFIKNFYLATGQTKIGEAMVVDTSTGFIAEIDGLDLSFITMDDETKETRYAKI